MANDNPSEGGSDLARRKVGGRHNQHKKRPLHEACRDGQLGQVRYLLDSKRDRINSLDSDGRTPFWIACEHDHVSIARYLMQRGAAVDRMHSVVVCSTAAATGRHHHQQQQQEEGQAPTDEIISMTPLGCACRSGSLATVKFLLSEGDADENNVQEGSITALMVAVQANQVETVRFLLSWFGTYWRFHKSLKDVCPAHEEQPKLKSNNRHIKSSNNNTDSSSSTAGRRETVLHLAAQQVGIAPEILRLLVLKGGYHVDSALALLMMPDEDEANRQLRTPLHCACMNGLTENAKTLVELGASVHLADAYGNTALHWVCWSRSFPTQKDKHDLIRYLLEAGARVDGMSRPGAVIVVHDSDALLYSSASPPGPEGTPLHSLCQDPLSGEKCIDSLLEYGAHVDATDSFGFTPLYIAYQLGHSKIVDYLLQRRVNVNARNGYERTTVLHKATFDGCRERIDQFFDSGAHLNIANRMGWTVLHFCVRSTSRTWLGAMDRILEQLDLTLNPDEKNDFINQRDNEGCTALFLACRIGYAAKAEMLLENGADPNIPGVEGGAEVDTWYYPAFVALKWGHEIITALLLSNSADIDAPNGRNGMTLLHHACSTGSFGVIRLLLAEGASLHRFSTREGWNALHYAAAGGHCDGLRLLVDILSEAPDPDCSIDPALVEAKDFHGCTPLHYACWCGQFGTTQLLLEGGACPTVRDKSGLLPLQKACKSRNCSTVMLLLGAMAGEDWFRGRAQECKKRSAVGTVRGGVVKKFNISNSSSIGSPITSRR